jgi:hypothetical protein
MRQHFLAAVAILSLAASGGAAADAPVPPAPVPPAALPPAPARSVDWAAFLARSDLVWPQMPTAANQAPFIGNGSIGALIHLEGNGALGWDVNRTDVTNRGMRLAMGHLVLLAGGPASAGTARLDLWNAEARGTLATPNGEVQWRSFASAAPSVLVIELSGFQPGKEVDLLWWPVLAHAPRRAGRATPYDPADLNAPPLVTTGVGVVTSTQTFAGGGAFAVVLRRIFSGPQRRVYAVAIGKGAKDTSALAEAASAVERADALGYERLRAAHRAWWQQYYPASFVSFPDRRLEAFYWIQMYKLASAMRPDGPIPGLEGPWFLPVPLEVIDWDLNVPLTYAPLFTANRLNLGESLFGALDRGRQNLVGNVAPALRPTAAAIGHDSDQDLVSPVDLASAQTDRQREAGNLPLAAYLFWKYSRYRMDDQVLRERVLPLLTRTTAFYLASLQLGPDGRYHLPPTLSPTVGSAADAGFDLALLRWSLQTLVEASARLRLADPRAARWSEVLAHLAPLPTGGAGLLIGRGRPLRESQARPSHLLAILPLHLLRPDRPGDRRTIEASLRTWESQEGSFRGFSHAGAAAIHAYLGEGDRAVAQLQTQLDRFLTPNTFDVDPATALAAPLAAAASIQDLLLQSWGGRLHVFPAMPAAWKGAAFSNLRGEGAFLVSAVWRDGAAAWVRIDSQAGGTCRLEVAGWTSAVVRTASSRSIALAAGGPPGGFAVALPRGSWVVLAASPAAPLPPLAAWPATGPNPYPTAGHG